MNKIKGISLLIIFLSCFMAVGLKFEQDKTNSVKFYSPRNGIYIVDVNVKKCPDCITPYVSETLETVQDIGQKTKSFASINTGFFDPINQMTTSFITKDGKLAADPYKNKNLMENPNLKPYLNDILNRSEFRIIDCPNKTRTFDIASHNTPVESRCKIIHSIQAGPELLPDLKLEEEAFVVKKNNKVIKQSAGALRKFARSAVGIKQDHVLFVVISNKAPMTLPELAEYMRSLNLNKAMAFDGGSSTSLYLNLKNKNKFVMNSEKNNKARKIKSAILISN